MLLEGRWVAALTYGLMIGVFLWWGDLSVMAAFGVGCIFAMGWMKFARDTRRETRDAFSTLRVAVEDEGAMQHQKESAELAYHIKKGTSLGKIWRGMKAAQIKQVLLELGVDPQNPKLFYFDGMNEKGLDRVVFDDWGWSTPAAAMWLFFKDGRLDSHREDGKVREERHSLPN